MAVQWIVTVKKTESIIATRKGFNDIMRAALEEGGRLWIREFLPQHFAPGAFGRYHYQPRTHRWDAMKKRLTGQVLPLIFTGDMRDTVLRNATGGVIKPTARGTGGQNGSFKLTVPVGYPHPLNPKYSSSTLGEGQGEVVRKLKYECEAMAKAINAKVHELTGKYLQTTVVRL